MTDRPRLVVPPPPMRFSNNKPSLTITGVTSYDYQDEFGDHDFLEKLSRISCSLSIRMLEWRYEERRQAQSILPFLFLGPSTAAQDRDYIISQGITLLVAVRHSDSLQSRLVTSLKRAEELNLETAVVIAPSASDMIGQLPTAIKAINDHLQRQDQRPSPSSGYGVDQIKGKALVFCENGSDRSPAVVIGYLMAMYNLSTVEAIQAVESQRFCIAIDEPMKQMLLDFEAILKAKREVAANNRIYMSTANGHLSPNRSTISRKRSFDVEDGLEDESMSLEGQDINAGARAGSAPFRDWHS